MSNELRPRWLYDCGHCKLRWNCGPRCACMPNLVDYKRARQCDQEKDPQSYPENRRWFHIEMPTINGVYAGGSFDAEVVPAVPEPMTFIRYRIAKPGMKRNYDWDMQKFDWKSGFFVRFGKHGTLVCTREEHGASMLLTV